MKKIFLLVLLQMIFGLIRAQYTLQPTLPMAGMMQKSQLWNVLVVNSTNNTINCRLELTLRDRTSGLEQMNATTNQFTLGKGAKQLSNATLAPIQYNVIGNGFIRAGNDELLPIGNYIVCYRLTLVIPEPTTLAEECSQFDIEPLSPPMLAFPSDSSVLNIQPSQFTWIPPSPMTLFNQLSYEIMIAEVLPGQKAEEAIQQNLPFYMESNKPNNLLTYTGTGGNFQKDKWYAWQVIAKDDRAYAAKSEVWVFKIKDSVIQKIPTSIAYYPLNKSTSDAAMVTVKNGNDLFVKYYSYDKPYVANIIIESVAGAKKLQQKQVKIAYGENFFSVQLDPSVKKGETYLLTLVDTKGVGHYLLFKKEQ